MIEEERASGKGKGKKELLSRRPTAFFGALFLIVALISTAVVIRGFRNAGDSSGADYLDPLIQELASNSPDSLPDYALSEKKTQAGYVAALEIPDVLEKVPCYCGCGAVGHKSLRDCFLNDDGTFEDHASYCDLCISESLDVYMWYKMGLIEEDIRSRIIEKYSRYGEPNYVS